MTSQDTNKELTDEKVARLVNRYTDELEAHYQALGLAGAESSAIAWINSEYNGSLQKIYDMIDFVSTQKDVELLSCIVDESIPTAKDFLSLYALHLKDPDCEKLRKAREIFNRIPDNNYSDKAIAKLNQSDFLD